MAAARANPSGALIALHAASIANSSMIHKKPTTNTQLCHTALPTVVEDNTQPTPEFHEGQCYLVSQQNDPVIKCPPNDKMLGFHMQEAHFKSEIAALESLSGPLNSNLRWARRAKVHVRAQLTYGSNALPDAKLTQEEAKARYATMEKAFTARLKESIQRGSVSARFVMRDPSRPVVFLKTREMARLMSEMLKKYGFGVCSHQSAAAYCYLIDRVPPGTRVELCQFVGSDHEVVAIGLRPNADPKDISTWGPHTVICDPWADLEYPLSQLAEMQQPVNDVKRHVGSAGQHYLAGHLCAYGELYGWPMN